MAQLTNTEDAKMQVNIDFLINIIVNNQTWIRLVFALLLMHHKFYVNHCKDFKNQLLLKSPKFGL